MQQQVLQPTKQPVQQAARASATRRRRQGMQPGLAAALVEGEELEGAMMSCAWERKNTEHLSKPWQMLQLESRAE